MQRHVQQEIVLPPAIGVAQLPFQCYCLVDAWFGRLLCDVQCCWINTFVIPIDVYFYGYPLYRRMFQCLCRLHCGLLWCGLHWFDFRQDWFSFDTWWIADAFLVRWHFDPSISAPPSCFLLVADSIVFVAQLIFVRRCILSIYFILHLMQNLIEFRNGVNLPGNSLFWLRHAMSVNFGLIRLAISIFGWFPLVFNAWFSSWKNIYSFF